MKVRIYFNRLADAPKIWSYDHGTQETEVLVTGWLLHGCDVTAGKDLSVPMGDQDRPRVWVEVQNADRVEVIDGVVHVHGESRR